MDWTTWLQFTLTGCGAIVSFAGLFAGIGYFRQGKKKEILDGQTEELNTINLLKNDVETLQKQVKELTQKVETLTKDNEAKTKKLDEWMLVFQGRDPAMQTFMKMMETYIATNSPMLEAVKSKALPTIERLEKYLDKQTF